jgi:hypothetical protein
LGTFCRTILKQKHFFLKKINLQKTWKPMPKGTNMKPKSMPKLIKNKC